MSSTSLERKKLLATLDTAIQRQTTLTVLFTNMIAHQIGLSATEFECWDVIRNNQPITAGKLANLCGLTTGAITGLVDRLVRDGFVKRVPDPEDRRRVYIETVANAKRQRHIHALYQEISDRFDEVTSIYSEAELSLIVEYLDRTNDMANEIIISKNKK